MEENERAVRYIMLTLMKGLGCVRRNALLAEFGGIDELFRYAGAAGDPDSMNGGLLRIFLQQWQSIEIRRRAEEICETARKRNIQVITREDEDYPKRFGTIPDSPAVIYVLGKLRINEYKASLGIVGARRCTKEGKQEAIEAAVKAIGENKAVVSGMAKGVDSYAHTAAVKSDGYTIAVLGNGPDICYPKEHMPLYEKIIETGCVLSEYAPGTAPRSYTFPQRNRIIAALSDEILVIEAGRMSGTRTTVAAWERKK